MTKRRKWTAIPGLAALAAGAIMLSAYSGASSSKGNQPTQPIAFPHNVHVKTLGVNCVYCHYTANKSPDPGLPAVGTCMGCHLAVGPQRPAIDGKPARKSADIQKLWDYYKGGEWLQPQGGPRARRLHTARHRRSYRDRDRGNESRPACRAQEGALRLRSLPLLMRPDATLSQSLSPVHRIDPNE
jgi:hypothetical protein